MRTWIVTAAALVLLSPAVIFMGALLFRSVGSLQNQPAHAAQQVVLWYAGRMWSLWVLLLALPSAALAMGCATLKQNWNRYTNAGQFARQSLAIGAATITAGGVLAIVVLHMLAN